jgi:allantoin racemase
MTAMTMIRLLVINPNSTEAMTVSIADAARRAAGEGTEIIAKTNMAGPPSIQGEADGVAAMGGVLALIASASNNVDAAIIACFDDTGLSEARALAPFPVVGIGEASYILAGLLAERFSVVTTLAASIPVLEDNILRGGWASRCSSVRASGVPVLSLENDPCVAANRVATEIARSVAEDGVRTVVLGCAGMSRHLDALSTQLGCSIHLVEPVAAGTRLALAAAVSVRK